MDEGQSIHIGVTGFSTAFTAVLAFLGRKALKDIDETKERIAQHQLEDANKFMPRAEIQPSLERIHSRIDTMADDIKSLIRESK